MGIQVGISPSTGGGIPSGTPYALLAYDATGNNVVSSQLQTDSNGDFHFIDDNGVERFSIRSGQNGQPTAIVFWNDAGNKNFEFYFDGINRTIIGLSDTGQVVAFDGTNFVLRALHAFSTEDPNAAGSEGARIKIGQPAAGVPIITESLLFSTNGGATKKIGTS